MHCTRCLWLPGLLLFTMLAASAETFVSTDVPKVIPDGPAGIAESHLNIAVNRVIVDVNVTLSIAHTFDGDLGIYLLAPSGDVVRLAFRCGHAGHNYTATTFDDEATASVVYGAAPFTGPYIPDQPLQALDGQSTQGLWLLRVTDFAHGDTGTTLAWQLDLTLGDPLAAPQPAVPAPVGFALAAYPNPFNATTRLTFTLAQSGHVTLAVYNLTGQQVGVFADAVYPAGVYSQPFDGSELATGVYLARLSASGLTRTTCLLLIK
jgi:subtilisin-like proprotein convertase family protein